MTVLNKFSENRKRVLSNSFEFKITLMPKQYEILQKKKNTTAHNVPMKINAIILIKY